MRPTPILGRNRVLRIWERKRIISLDQSPDHGDSASLPSTSFHDRRDNCPPFFESRVSSKVEQDFDQLAIVREHGPREWIASVRVR